MENVKTNTVDRELFLSRTLNAPVDLVWEMFSTPEHIANWWGPDGFTNTIRTLDLRPGGAWSLIMHGPDGTDYDNKSVFTEVTVNERIVFEHLNWPHHITTIEFTAQGEKTLLTWHMLFDSAEQLIEVVKKHGAAEGMKQNVQRLEKYLENANHS